MVERLCKAKSIETNQWIEGYYIHLHKTTYCFTDENDDSNEIHRLVYEHITDWGLPNKHFMVDINPNTLCRCTGLSVSGNLFYEYDRIVCKTKSKSITGVIIFKNGAFYVEDCDKEVKPKLLSYYIENSEIKIIGNEKDQ